MANTTIPPQGSGADTPFDNLVGVQLVTGGGLTNGNFEFTTSVTSIVIDQSISCILTVCPQAFIRRTKKYGMLCGAK